MTGNKVFLDTNIVIEVFAGNIQIADKIKELSGFFISSIVLGELYIGVRNDDPILVELANKPTSSRRKKREFGGVFGCFGLVWYY